ncbi:hypothetical protein TNCV_1255321 [Trichonephila clavipes]|nr:hypothetical protein TNCV_1255321 [Trichonephila clavipes]
MKFTNIVSSVWQRVIIHKKVVRAHWNPEKPNIGFLDFIPTARMQSKGRTRQDAGHKDQSLQDIYRLFAWKFFQKQQQGHAQAKELFSTYVVMRLMPRSDSVQLSMLCGNLGRPSW